MVDSPGGGRGSTCSALIATGTPSCTAIGSAGGGTTGGAAAVTCVGASSPGTASGDSDGAGIASSGTGAAADSIDFVAGNDSGFGASCGGGESCGGGDGARAAAAVGAFRHAKNVECATPAALLAFSYDENVPASFWSCAHWHRSAVVNPGGGRGS